MLSRPAPAGCERFRRSGGAARAYQRAGTVDLGRSTLPRPRPRQRLGEGLNLRNEPPVDGEASRIDLPRAPERPSEAPDQDRAVVRRPGEGERPVEGPLEGSVDISGARSIDEVDCGTEGFGSEASRSGLRGAPDRGPSGSLRVDPRPRARALRASRYRGRTPCRGRRQRRPRRPREGGGG